MKFPEHFAFTDAPLGPEWDGRRTATTGAFATVRRVKQQLTDTDSPHTKGGTSTEHRDDPNWLFGKNPPGFTPGGV